MSKKIFLIPLLIFLISSFLLPLTASAQETNWPLKQNEVENLLDLIRKEPLTEANFELFNDTILDKPEAARKTAAVVLVKQIILKKQLDYWFKEVPKQFSIKFIKTAFKVIPLIYSQDISGVIDFIEKLSVQKATDYAIEWLVQNEIKIGTGELTYAFPSYKGNWQEIKIQYIIVYHPLNQNQGKIVVEFYSKNPIEPPLGTGGLGGADHPNSNPWPLDRWLPTEEERDNDGKLEPFIVRVKGYVTKNRWGRFKWNDSKKGPTVEIDFDNPVPEIENSDFILANPPSKTSLTSEIIKLFLEKLKSKTSEISTNFLNIIKDYLSGSEPEAQIAKQIILEQIKEGEISPPSEPIPEFSKEKISEKEEDLEETPEQEVSEETPPTLEDLKEKLDEISDEADALAARIKQLLAEKESNQPEEELEEEKKEESQEIVICSFSDTRYPAMNKVIFNEIAWMGTKNSSNDEWMELKNISGSAIDLNGWQILDKAAIENKTRGIKIIFEDASISSGGLFLLERTDDSTVPGIPADLIYTGSLSNTNEALYLFDKDCNLQDMVKAAPDWPAGDNSSKKTMERKSDLEWQTSKNDEGTPKAKNSSGYYESPEEASNTEGGLTPSLSSSYPKILISEVKITEKTGDKNIFIELYNPNDFEVNLTDWYIFRNDSSFITKTLLKRKKISSKNYFLITRKGSTWENKADILLDDKTLNEDDKITLKNPKGEIGDEVSWSQIPSGFSLGRKWNGQNYGDFEIQTPTPGEKNQSLEPQPILEISTTTISFEVQEDGENPATTTLTIRNTGGAEMIWAVTTTYGTTTPTSTEWLSLQPTTGTLAVSSSTEIEFSVNISGLEAGNYQATATIEAAGAQNSPQKIQVKLAITEKETPSPETPSGIEVLPQELNFFMEVNGSSPPHQNLIIKNHTSEEVNWTISGWGYLKTTENSGVTPPKGISLIESWFYLHPNLQIEPGKTYSGTTTVSLKSEFLKKEIEIPVTLTVLPKTSRKVVINEIAWMGTQADYNDEWIELYNNTNEEINLNDWVINWREGTTTRSINLDGNISAYGFYFLERTASTTISDIKEDQIYTGNLNNGGEKLELLDLNSNLIDEVDCSNGWFAGNNKTKQTMERINPQALGSDPNNWGTYNGTTTYGVDAKGNPIKGTPKQQNSVFQSEPPSPRIPQNARCEVQHNTVTLTWEISGEIFELFDDSLQNHFLWDIRYSRDNPINEDNWEESTKYQGAINIDSEDLIKVEIENLYYDSNYYFGIKGFNGSDYSSMATTSCEIDKEVPQWPMYGYDAQHTFKTSVAGPVTSTIKWQLEAADAKLPSYARAQQFSTGPAVDQNGTIYIGTSKGLLALDKNGNFKWQYSTTTRGILRAPLIGQDGTIYILISENKILALSPSGKLRWQKPVETSFSKRHPYEPNVNLVLTDNVLYYATRLPVGTTTKSALIAINPETGETNWSYTFSGSEPPSTPTITEQGTILIGFKQTLFILNSDGSLKKEFEFNPTCGSQNQTSISMVGIKGEKAYFILRGTYSTGGRCSYCGDSLYVLLNPDSDNSTTTLLAEKMDNTQIPLLLGQNKLYLKTNSRRGYSCNITSYLYSFDYQEKVLWSTSTTHATLWLIDSQANLFGSYQSGVIALNSDGKIIWDFVGDAFQYPFALSKQGVLYAPSNHILYAFGPEE